jgi:putative hemolysin
MHTPRHFFPALLITILLLVAACRQPSPWASPTATAVPAQKPTAVPAEVAGAHRAVVEFMRAGAFSAVPARNATWQESSVTVPEKFAAHQYQSADVTLIVTWKEEDAEAYHVSLRNETSGYCWQAIVDRRGQVVKTGLEAETAAVPGNAAADYCIGQGYNYVIRETEENSLCSYCVFPDGSECKSWLYFYGECAPGTP